jgi:mRNA-degrading endonuclease RelE of RelBE toxin-antitoxin system
MAYNISFARDAETIFKNLGSDAERYLTQKLEKVATCEWRSPYDWDYSPWSGQSTGKFSWGSYRVFVDVDEEADEIVVYEVRHRENLYR